MRQSQYIEKGINDLPSIRFSATRDSLDAPSSINASDNFSVFVVVDPTKNVTTAGSVIAARAYVNEVVHGGDNAGVALSVGTNSVQVGEYGATYTPILLTHTGTQTEGTSVVLLVYNNQTPSIYINGDFIATGTTSTRPESTFYMNQIGSDSAHGTITGFEGDMGEMILYSRVLSSVEREAVTNYLMDKWGIK